MTNQEAIELLKIERDHMTPTLLTEHIEAMDMAISALQEKDAPDANTGDMISRQAAIDAVDSETISTNPEHFKSSEKFIKFMDDADIASFGKWQWANGFNTALTAVGIDLKKLPSTQREIVRCKDCKHWREHKYAKETKRYIPFCGFNAIYTKADDFCCKAERRTDEQN